MTNRSGMLVWVLFAGFGLGACQADDSGDDDGGDSGSAEGGSASGGSASGGSASGGSASGGSASGGSASGGSASGGSAEGGSAEGSTTASDSTGGSSCEGAWYLGETPYVGDTILDACDANPPQNCADGHYIVFDDTNECICLPLCSSFVDTGLGDACNESGSVVCQAIANDSGSSSGNFCVPTQWGLCGP